MKTTRRSKTMRRLMTSVIFLASLASMAHFSFAAPPTTSVDAVLGDWDMGPTANTALRISYKDSNSIFVQFCGRDLFLAQHVCEADMILYFTFSQTSQEFVHDDNAAEHLHATLQISPDDSTLVQYIFKSDAGAGTMTGRKIWSAMDGSVDGSNE
jgi:hypothetical protein